jgi:hypothetical protein
VCQLSLRVSTEQRSDVLRSGDDRTIRLLALSMSVLPTTHDI